jgi:hypothetical protein
MKKAESEADRQAGFAKNTPALLISLGIILALIYALNKKTGQTNAIDSAGVILHGVVQKLEGEPKIVPERWSAIYEAPSSASKPEGTHWTSSERGTVSITRNDNERFTAKISYIATSSNRRELWEFEYNPATAEGEWLSSELIQGKKKTGYFKLTTGGNKNSICGKLTDNKIDVNPSWGTITFVKD